MSRPAGSIVRGFQSRAGYPSNGPAAGGGYVLPARPKVKVRRNQRTDDPSPDSRVVTFKAARNNRPFEFSLGELAEQAPRGKKINSFKTFGEPVVNPFQQLDGLPLAALIDP
jgi:hypothetical protein